VKLRLRDETLELRAERPLVMGIVNVTPDSVSDAVRRSTDAERIEHGERLLAAGAHIIDVGGESGRTDAPAVSSAEEVRRVLPVVSALAERGARVSIDTFRPEVAAAAVGAGACMINDVSGLADPEMARIAADTGAALVVMETRAAPKTASFVGYDDPIRDVLAFLGERAGEARAAGVDEDQLILDPGLDYSKTPAESVAVLRGFGTLRQLGRPLLLAVSNKYFVGVLTDRRPHERLGGTLAAVGAGVEAGASLLRVHDVGPVVDFLEVRAALAGAPGRVVDPYDDDRLKWLPR
jgi:dihydropteroate synthase